ncbi:MAG: putative fimbrial-like protein SfmF [Acinetobacter bereziniae]|uniref:Putative fimbrial-like protein SfmF n=1 Tax=Acinetobacter bereziniae TaxID=106648 RepID=A0A833PDD0_ACIBZ|nr:MAG: putative fimbrial-like protein SfmF [Acinetobacter bereziniae]
MNEFRKNLYRTAYLLMMNIGLYSYAHADLGTYNFILKGNATNSTCGVEESEAHKIVDMGLTSTKFLTKPGDKGPRVAIPFNLVLCPVGTEVRFTFIGEQNPVNNQLLALSNPNAATSAQHVAIELTDSNRNRVPISKTSRFPDDLANKSRAFLVDANGNASVVFYANYIATDASATPGFANAYAEFWVEYQ